MSEIRQDMRGSNSLFVHSRIDDVGLTAAEFRIYGHLSRRANNSGMAWPGIDSMALICQLNRSTVISAIQELQARNMLKVSKASGATNKYLLTSHEDWAFPKTDQSEIRNGGSEIGNGTSRFKGTKGNPSEGNPNKDIQNAPEGALFPDPKKKSETSEGVISKLPIPKHLDTEAFQSEWKEWVVFRMKNKKCKDWVSVFKRHLKSLSTVSELIALETIDKAISGNWAMPYVPKPGQTTGFQGKKQASSLTLQQEIERSRGLTSQRDEETRRLQEEFDKKKASKEIK